MYNVPPIPDDFIGKTPEAVLASSLGAAWTQELAGNFPTTRYYLDRSTTWSLKELNKAACTIIDAKYAGECHEAALEDEFPSCREDDVWYDAVVDPLQDALGEAFEHQTNHGQWTDIIRQIWTDKVSEADDSNLKDLFGGHDYVELLFRFSTNPYLDDALVYSHKAWPDFEHLSITESLQFALNQLGYTIGDYRRASKSKHQAYSQLSPTRPKREPVISMAAFEEMIENACSTNFLIAAYAVVPIREVMALDLTRPFTLQKSWIATTDPINGTFFEVPTQAPLTLNPGDGKLMSGAHLHYSPDDICGLHLPHYHSSIQN